MLVICNGMMRAGSTLQYNLVRCLLQESSKGESHGYWEPSALDSNPALHSWLESTTRHAIKMHGYWVHSKPMRHGQLKRCYIYRDIRDVAASAKRKFPITWDELLVVLDETIDLHNQIIESPETLSQRYEETIANPIAACRELANYVGLDISLDRCRRTTERCLAELTRLPTQLPRRQRFRHGFDYARVRLTKKMIGCIPTSTRSWLRRLGLQQTSDAWTATRSQMDPTTLIHPDHFSPTRGQPGSWERVFDLEEKAVLQERFSAWLQRHNYPVSDLEQSNSKNYP